MRRDDLRTWFRACGTTSASEVAKIDHEETTAR